MLIRAKPSPGRRGGHTPRHIPPTLAARRIWHTNRITCDCTRSTTRIHIAHDTVDSPRCAYSLLLRAVPRGREGRGGSLGPGGGSPGGARLTWPASASEHASPAIPTALGL